MRLPGYRVDSLIYEGSRTRVHRGLRVATGEAVVIKTLRARIPGERELASLERAHALGRQHLACPGLIRHLAIEPDRGGLALVTEDIGGVGLQFLLQAEGMPLGSFLDLACSLARALGELHAAHIVHKDIKPHNVVLNPDDGRLKIIDLGISSKLPRELPTLTAPRQLEGTLPYISPEQTGRMNRCVDQRSDLYSLGVTLYQLATGRLPFDATDPMELVHCHIARQAPPPQELAPQVPPVLGRIIMKLLAKTADERYASAAGLARDLERCRESLRTRGEVVEFEIAREDLPPRLQLPQRLYGREDQLARLEEVFARAVGGGRELLLVTGYSGIGKSSLIHEVRRPILAREGAFCEGKFEQFRRDIPYSALVAALRDLLQQILTRGSEQVAGFERLLREDLGANAAVIAEVVPELARILGEQAPPRELPPLEARNRFNRSFRRFLRVFARPEHPLTVFVDDLQWADQPSLELLENLITDPESRHLLLVGAYRDNEVGPGHPLRELLLRLGDAGQPVQEIELPPLDEPTIRELLADTLARDPAELVDLAARVSAKTGGNPFFLSEFLQELERRRILRVDPAEPAWTWDLEALDQVDITDNVVDLMSAKLGLLPAATREQLKVAACIGNGFDLETLAGVGGVLPHETAAALEPALEEGLILPLDGSYRFASRARSAAPEAAPPQDAPQVGHTRYRFLHDRVHQAAHLLLPEAEQRSLHLRIGRLLWGERSAEELGEALVDVVNHLVLGRAGIAAPEERLRVAELALAAGRRAKSSMAFAPTRRYLRAGMELLPGEAWNRHHRLTLALHHEAADVAYLLADFEEMNTLADEILARARDVLDKVPVWRSLIHAGVAQARYDDTIDLAVEVLAQLGVELPRRANDAQVGEAMQRALEALDGRDPLELSDLPELSDPRAAAALEILTPTAPCAYFVAPNQFVVICFEMLRVTVASGLSEHAAYGFALNGLVFSAALGQVDRGYAFGQLARTVLDRYEEGWYHGKAGFLVDTFIRHWKEPYGELSAAGLDDYRCCLNHGDLETAAYATTMSLYMGFLSGQKLGALLERYEEPIRTARAFKQSQSVPILAAWTQLIECFIEDEPVERRLRGRHFEAEAGLAAFEREGNFNGYYQAALAAGILAVFQRDPVQARARLEQAATHPEATLGQPAPAAQAFYLALALCWWEEPESEAERRARAEQLDALEERLARLAEHAPSNHRHKLELVRAERHRLRGEEGEAIGAFQRAGKGALEQGVLHEAALAYERLGELCAELHWEEMGAPCLAKAYALYQRWGARAKCATLAARHGVRLRDHAFPSEPASPGEASESLADTSTAGFHLDLNSALKAARSISAEIKLERLLDRLLRILLENAGARRALLILRRDSGLVLAAVGRADQQVTVSPSSLPLDEVSDCPQSVINYVAGSGQPVVLADALDEGLFRQDPYFTRSGVRSVLCLPVEHQGQLSAILYLEHELSTGVFSEDRVELLEVLVSQAAVSIENASLYNDLELRVQEKTQHLRAEIEERIKVQQELEHTLQRLRDLQDQIITQEKLASLGALTAGLAHQISNPLNFIKNFAELSVGLSADLTQEIAEVASVFPADKREFVLEDLQTLQDNVARIRDHSQRTNGVVRGMLAHARGQGGQRRPHDMERLFEQAIQSARAEAEAPAGLELARDFAPDLGEVEVYAQSLRQALGNILDNALYALRERAERAEPGYRPRLSLRSRAHGDWIDLSIEDNGTGIPATDLEQVLNPFFTTKPAGKGAGLGLSICQDVIVKLHGGELRVESTQGEFTRVHVRIPRGEISSPFERRVAVGA